MQEIQNLLRNPIIRHGLRLSAPEVAIGVEALILIISGVQKRKKRAKLENLLAMIDQRLAKVIEELATTESEHMKTECEIRAHELLGLLNEWEKNT